MIIKKHQYPENFYTAQKGGRQRRLISLWGTLTTLIRSCFSHRASGVLRNPTNKDLKEQGMLQIQLMLQTQLMLVTYGLKRLGTDGIPLVYAFTRLWVSLS